MSTTPRRLALGLLVALLALPSAPAAAAPLDPGALLSKLRGWLSFVWAENGCEIEPAGRCGSVTIPPAESPVRREAILRDNGCELEPNGRCAAILRDNGCEIEPNGRCGN